VIRAALFDLGGVIFTSPFDAFARYERARGLPVGFIRRVNAANPDENAWARLERGGVSFEEFCDLFQGEARALGGEIDAREVMELVEGDVRPEMLEAVRRCHERLKTGLLTNNWVTVDGARKMPADRSPTGARGMSANASPNVAAAGPRKIEEALRHFDVVIESSRVGVRKPDPRFYRMACGQLGIEPAEAVFLDDLGVNLKPARDMGMTTIKVVDAARAIDELERVVGFPLRAGS
jgi:putative hydrolase of the HAD superfamily